MLVCMEGVLSCEARVLVCEARVLVCGARVLASGADVLVCGMDALIGERSVLVCGVKARFAEGDRWQGTCRRRLRNRLFIHNNGFNHYFYTLAALLLSHPSLPA